MGLPRDDTPWNATPRRVMYLALLGAMILLWIFGVNHYSVWCYSDLRAFLFPARDLADGHLPVYFPPYEVLKDYHFPLGRWFYKYFQTGREGQLVSYVGHGFPLLLAASIRLFGITAPFLFNTVLTGLLPLGLFLAVAGALSGSAGEGRRWRVAVLSGCMILLIPVQTLLVNLAPYRDLSKYVLILLSLTLLMRRRGRALASFFSGALLAYAVWIKTDSLFMLLPVLACLCLAGNAGSPRDRAKNMLFFFAGLLAGLIPAFWQNWMDRGNVWQFAQMTYLRSAARKGPSGEFSIYAISTNAWPYLKDVILQSFGWWSLLLIWGLLVGLWCRSALFFLFGVSLVVHVVAGATGHVFWSRYQVGTFLSCLPFMALGLDDLALRMARAVRCVSLRGSKLIPVAIYSLVMLAILYQSRVLYTTRRQSGLTVEPARRFAADLTACLTPGCAVISEDELRPLIDYLVPCYGLSRTYLSDDQHDLPTTVRTLMRAGFPVYYFDNETVTPGKEKMWKYLPNRVEVMNELLDYFDLIPLRSFSAKEYSLGEFFVRKTCSLYQLKEWSSGERNLRIPATSGAETGLRINLRSNENSKLIFEVQGFLSWTQSVHGGWNYLLLPQASWPVTNLIVRGERKLPGDLQPFVFNLADPMTFRPGRYTEPLDKYYFACSNEVFEQSRSGREVKDQASLIVPWLGSTGQVMRLDFRVVMAMGCEHPGLRLEMGTWATNLPLTCVQKGQEFSIIMENKVLRHPETTIRFMNLDPVATNDYTRRGILLEGLRLRVNRASP
ncbi:MAG: hypothetical protein V2A34_00720 [Lentisphaerota bacterium]